MNTVLRMRSGLCSLAAWLASVTGGPANASNCVVTWPISSSNSVTAAALSASDSAMSDAISPFDSRSTRALSRRALKGLGVAAFTASAVLVTDLAASVVKDLGRSKSGETRTHDDDVGAGVARHHAE